MHLFIKSFQNCIKPSVKIKTYATKTANTNVETQKQSLMPIRELNLVFNQST